MRELFELSTNLELSDTEVRTPPALVEEMLDRLPATVWSDPSTRFMDPCAGTGTFVLCIIDRLMRGLEAAIPNGAERIEHILANQVWAYDVCPRQVRRLLGGLRKLGVEHLARNVYNCNVLEQEFDMKFDVIVGNPPYQKGLHLKFLEMSYDNADHVVFVHPSEWLIQKRKISKNSHKRKMYQNLKNKINKRCSKIVLLDSPWGKDVQLWVPLVVTCIAKEETDSIEFINNEKFICSTHRYNDGFKEILSSIHDVHRFGQGNIARSIVEKVSKIAEKNNWEMHHEKLKGNYFLSLPNFMGHAQKMDYQLAPDLIGKDRIMCATFSLTDSLEIYDKPQKSKPQGQKEEGNTKPWISFEKEKDAQNALNFLSKTKFIRSFLTIIKIDQHACDSLLSEIPWLDWSIGWNDESINKLMDFNKEEIEWIENAFQKICK